MEDMEGGLEEAAMDEELYQVDNFYALFAFYEDLKCLSHGEIFVHLRVQVPGEPPQFLDLQEKLANVAELLKISTE